MKRAYNYFRVLMTVFWAVLALIECWGVVGLTQCDWKFGDIAVAFTLNSLVLLVWSFGVHYLWTTKLSDPS